MSNIYVIGHNGQRIDVTTHHPGGVPAYVARTTYVTRRRIGFWKRLFVYLLEAW